uniref:CD209 antigen-like protein 2 n=1 Tax=Labrus bergylta TaxID=56723 RepID=A0A3Q3LZM9_9LABR|nr:CD209 antigen-like protein 2 [Labrus bergylta]
MDESDIYANVDEPPGQPCKRTGLLNGSEIIYANEEIFQTLEMSTAGTSLTGAGHFKKSLSRIAAVCLGLLCVFLLTGLITLMIQYNKHNSEWKSDMIMLNISNNNLSKERNQLQSSYNNLDKERNQLQSSYNNLDKERNQLQSSYNNLAQERDMLQNRLEEVQKKLLEGLKGWVHFNGSFYYISSLEKPWQESRADCLQRGADLMIINSKEEQDFARSFQKLVWIGLSDREKEGTWKWVDGTPLNTSYWNSREPNGVPNRDEDCTEIKMYALVNSWNDESCELRRFWICEKTFNM